MTTTPERGVEEIKAAMALDFAHLDEADWQKILAYVASLETTLHHQLQKARQDWLREEIVRLEEDLRMNGGDVRIEAICKRLKDSIKNIEK